LCRIKVLELASAGALIIHVPWEPGIETSVKTVSERCTKSSWCEFCRSGFVSSRSYSCLICLGVLVGTAMKCSSNIGFCVIVC
jgi:hypothetical protein